MGVPLSRRLSLDLTLRPRLILGMDTMGTDIMDTTMERDLLMLSPLPKPLPTLRPRLILGTYTTDTTDTASDITMDTAQTDMDTMDTAQTDMFPGSKLKPTTTCCFSLPTLL